MMRALYKKLVISILIFGSLVFQGSILYREFIPLSSGGSGINSDLNSPIFITGPESFEKTLDTIQSETEKLAYREFVNSVVDGTEGLVRGVYSEDAFALRIVQQPRGQPSYVSSEEGEATQFSMANHFNVTGILAHNYLSGRHFSILDINDIIHVVYGSGEILKYRISEIQAYQALQPESPSSDFVELDSGELLSSKQLFNLVYKGNHHLTLQTCIREGTEDSWGRLFIIAYPL